MKLKRLPKKGGLDSLLIQRGGLGKIEGSGVFEVGQGEGRGVDTLMPTMMKGEREGLCLFA